MERPKCEWGGIGGCERPATWMVGFVHSQRFRLSCNDHLGDWQKNGADYWSAELRGFFGDMDHVMEDAVRDNQHWGEAREAGALRATEEFVNGSENAIGEQVTLTELGS
jgi:hypothetical protein